MTTPQSPATIPVPFLDLKQQTAALRQEIRDAIDRVIDHGQYIRGPEVAALEEDMARYCEAAAAVGVASGTDALQLVLEVLGVGAGHEVITTPFTFFATAEVISRLGARPVFVDIEAGSYNIDPARIESAITKQTRAILPVHIFGLTADMDAIHEVAKKHGLPVVEDAAQAVGARYKRKRAGGLGTAACFSFYPTKNLGGMGDGGMVTAPDAGLVKKVRQISDHGQAGRKYFYEFPGCNSRLDSIQAAVLRVKLRYLDQWNARRRAIAALYRKRLAGTPVALPTEAPGYEPVYHLFTVRYAKREALVAHLKADNIGCMVYYPLCLHLQDAYKPLGYTADSLPEAYKAQNEVLSLPMYPELTDDQVHRVCDSVLAFLRQEG